jgi:hypothetical protein
MVPGNNSPSPTCPLSPHPPISLGVQRKISSPPPTPRPTQPGQRPSSKQNQVFSWECILLDFSGKVEQSHTAKADFQMCRGPFKKVKQGIFFFPKPNDYIR